MSSAFFKQFHIVCVLFHTNLYLDTHTDILLDFEDLYIVENT